MSREHFDISKCRARVIRNIQLDSVSKQQHIAVWKAPVVVDGFTPAALQQETSRLIADAGSRSEACRRRRGSDSNKRHIHTTGGSVLRPLINLAFLRLRDAH
jgi:hypothetical protein